MGLADRVAKVGRDLAKGRKDVADIITFIEAPWGLHMKLFPVQKIILKAHYGLLLDDKDKIVPITDFRKQNLQWMTEAEYLRHLYHTGRCNIREVVSGDERREMVLAVGRRSGKTLISSCVAAYETYKLIMKGDPQHYYGLPPSNVIQIISVATDKDQAGLLYNEVSGHFQQCSFFKPYQANFTQSMAKFQTPADIARYGSYEDDQTAKANIKVTFKSSIAKGLRGAGNIVVIMDEMAFFVDDGTSSAEAIYQALGPSTSAFTPKDPNDTSKPIKDDSEGRIIDISSPMGRQGLFYKNFQLGMTGGVAAKNMLCIQAPTWEVNPTVPAGEFEKNYAKDPVAFFTEFGAVFSDRTRGWIESEEDLMACVDPKARPVQNAPSRRPHFLGLDFALKGDGTAVAIGHIESRGGRNVIVTDLVDQIKAGEGRFMDREVLEFDDVVEWVYTLSKRFYITAGMFDHWAGLVFQQALEKKGLRQIKSQHMTDVLGSEIYRNFKDVMYNEGVVLYDYPIQDGEQHCEYITELLELQAEQKTKHIIKVEAPKIAGKHDDRSDAVVRMVWLATHELANPHYTTGSSASGRGGYVAPQRPLSNAMKLHRMGSHESRQIPVLPGSRMPGTRGPSLRRNSGGPYGRRG